MSVKALKAFVDRCQQDLDFNYDRSRAVSAAAACIFQWLDALAEVNGVKAQAKPVPAEDIVIQEP